MLAFVDANGDGKWELGETGLSMPLILVGASIHRDLSTKPVNKVSYTRLPQDLNQSWSQSLVDEGPLAFANGVPSTTCGTALGFGLANCAVVFAVEVDLVGGGNDGARGTSRVYGGWVQNAPTPNVVVEYQNNHEDVWVFASGVPQGHWPYLFPGDQPTLLGGPLLDTVNAQAGTGGNSSLLSTSQQGIVTDAMLNVAPTRRRRSANEP